MDLRRCPQLSGVMLRARVSLPEAAAVTVPRAAVIPDGDDEIAYVIRDGKAVRTPVRVGRRLRDRVQIEEGCAPGDRVVVMGQWQLTDGARVREEVAGEGR